MTVMKKLTILLVFIVLFVSCSKNDDDYIIWDFFNPSVEFVVVDADGNDLLNPYSDKNIISNWITLKHNGITYEYGPSSKATMPKMLGIRLEYSKSIGKWVLAFGEFAPDTNTNIDQEFIIDWGDGTKDNIKFDLYTTWKNNEPTVHKKIWLNDELYSEESFLVKLEKEPEESGIKAVSTDHYTLPEDFSLVDLEADVLHVFRNV